MGLKIWKPTCPSCGGGLNIREGQLYIQCENCQSSLIIEGWETRPKPPAKIPIVHENYNSWPTGTTVRIESDVDADFFIDYQYPHPPMVLWRKK